MDLQSTFYIVAITFISLWILLLLLLISGGVLLFRRFSRIQGMVERKIKSPSTNVILALTPVLPAILFVVSKLWGKRR